MHQVDDVLPDAFFQSLFPPLPDPPFEAAEELERVWGARWGANSEVGRLRSVLMRVAVFGTSIRCNDEGARQLEEVLRPLGIELLVVPLGGFSIHLDGAFGMVDVDKALVHVPGLPYDFLDRLRELGIEAIWCDPGELWAINSLVLAPGRVLMCEGYPRTAERLERRGVEVIAIPYGEIQKNGGGIHCSTMELVRDDV